MLVAFGIWHVGWSLYHIDTWLLFRFHEYCLLVIIISCTWDVIFILSFWGAIDGSTLFILTFPCINRANKMTHIACVDMVIPTFGCAVHFNPWYVDFISGQSSCEKQPLSKWLIVELFPLLWVKIGLIRNLLFVVYSILLGCYVSWPSLQLWSYCVGHVPGRISMEDMGGIASWSITIALHLQILFILQSLDV